MDKRNKARRERKSIIRPSFPAGSNISRCEPLGWVSLVSQLVYQDSLACDIVRDSLPTRQSSPLLVLSVVFCCIEDSGWQQHTEFLVNRSRSMIILNIYYAVSSVSLPFSTYSGSDSFSPETTSFFFLNIFASCDTTSYRDFHFICSCGTLAAAAVQSCLWVLHTLCWQGNIFAIRLESVGIIKP